MSFVRNPTAERQRKDAADGNETPPQSGSGGKEQIKSKAAPCLASSPLHSACSIVPAGADNGRSRAQPLRSLGVAQGWFSFAKRTTPAINAARRAAKQRQPLRKTPPSAQNFQKILPLLHKSGRQTPPCASFSEALRKKRSRKGALCRTRKKAPPRAAHP